MIVRVLGSAAGGGVPQWNCACANCSAARRGEIARRSQSSFAFSGDGERWWLINASPDIASQIESYPPLQTCAGRGTPIAGMLLTDANIDHIGGFAVVRQAGNHAFTIYSSPAVRTVALKQAAFLPFASPPHRWHTTHTDVEFELDARLRVTVIAIEGLLPGYAGRAALPDAVTAYAVRDCATGGNALFAPVFMRVGQALLAAAKVADVAFFDGSFWDDDELRGIGVEKTARSLGHLPVDGPDGTLAALRDISRAGRHFFTHLNNTNPLLDPLSHAAHITRKCGFEIAYDGLELFL
jgi:pyrroloquinoline quinone biosynthesis protein B